jgi:hypothetical protein
MQTQVQPALQAQLLTQEHPTADALPTPLIVRRVEVVVVLLGDEGSLGSLAPLQELRSKHAIHPRSRDDRGFPSGHLERVPRETPPRDRKRSR